MNRNDIVLVVLVVVTVVGCGCTSDTYPNAEDPEVQWAKEVPLKCAEQAIG